MCGQRKPVISGHRKMTSATMLMTTKQMVGAS
jgi:hypothetical protein